MDFDSFRIGGSRASSSDGLIANEGLPTRRSPARLHNGTLAMFERHGFTPSRRIGKHRWVVSRRA